MHDVGDTDEDIDSYHRNRGMVKAKRPSGFFFEFLRSSVPRVEKKMYSSVCFGNLGVHPGVVI